MTSMLVFLVLLERNARAHPPLPQIVLLAKFRIQVLPVAATPVQATVL